MSEEKKKDALADALAALAAGQHPEEPLSGSGIDAHGDRVGEAPTPPPAAPKRVGPPVPGIGGNPPKAGARPGVPVPRQGAPVPRQSSAPAPGSPPSQLRPPAPRAPASGPPVPSSGSRAPAPRAGTPRAPTPGVPAPAAPRPAAPKPGAPLRPSSPNAKARPTTPGQAPPAASPPHVEQFVVDDASLNDAAPQQVTAEEQAAAHEAAVAAEAEAIARVVEDDDTLNLPAPSPEMLAHRPAPPKRPQRELLSRTVGFKQTLIPILFTMGVIMAGVGVYSFVLGEESPVAGAPWIPTVLIATGAILLVFMAVTMMQVHNQLKRQSEHAAPT